MIASQLIACNYYSCYGFRFLNHINCEHSANEIFPAYAVNEIEHQDFIITCTMRTFRACSASDYAAFSKLLFLTMDEINIITIMSLVVSMNTMDIYYLPNPNLAKKNDITEASYYSLLPENLPVMFTDNNSGIYLPGLLKNNNTVKDVVENRFRFFQSMTCLIILPVMRQQFFLIN